MQTTAPDQQIKKRFQLTSTQIIPLGFLGVIIVGALILMLPFSTAAGEETDFLTALFTSTTSICVTGLVVVDTYSHWSLFGKIVILGLIQLGGFGVVTFYSIAMLMLHKRFSLKLRLLIRDYYNMDSTRGMIRFLKRVVIGTLLVEAFGALLYSFVFVPRFGFLKGVWVSVFNSVSAFCNAGMDILGPDSLISYQSNPAINLITIFLIVVGGLGYVVWFDILRTMRRVWKNKLPLRRLYKGLNEHTKLVLHLTVFLIIFGTVLVWIFERNNPVTIGELGLGDQLMASCFQSVTFRTAGFATIPQQNLTASTSALGLLLMFIGGSPVGTAGGVKTVTFFLVLLNMVCYIRGRDEAVAFGRRLSQKMINKASAIVIFTLGVALTMTVALCYFENVSFISAAYEIFSATATVGLSRGLTPLLENDGRIIVIIAMYLGRIGPISMGLLFAVNRPAKNSVSYSEGHFIIG